MLALLLSAGSACSDGAPPSAAPALPAHSDNPAPPPSTDPAPDAAERADITQLGTNDALEQPPPGPRADPNLEAPPELSDSAPQRIAARHLLLAYDGSVAASPKTRRTRAEAIRRAEDLLASIRSGTPLGTLAAQESDGPSASRNGSLGAFGRGTMDANFERAAFALDVGEVSGLVETPFGIHIIERLPLVEVHLGHVLVQWAGVNRSTTERTQAEALAIAETARSRLLAGEPLATVAMELSDGETGPRGGDLGWFQKGYLLPAFAPAFDLKRGEPSDVVETAFGYHVLVRID